MDYEAVIGLEVHAQLFTKTKIFCGCSTRFGEPPNTRVCPICMGMPGVLPVLNKEAVDFAIKTAIAANSGIAPFCKFARKNYFYPDLPKGYQISQYELPLAKGGYIEILVNGDVKKIGITRIHMEEDAGKNIHGTTESISYVDFNRAGVPLLEIVSEPDIKTPEDASEYLKKLRDILRYLEVCDGDMEKGSFRCDANVSIRPVGEKSFGVKTEIKNMNSFKFVQQALAYEIERQREVLKEGGTIVQETRLWDAEKGITVSMRTKEYAHDYRYFPEPDLLPLVVNDEWIEKLKKGLPELPDAKRERFVMEYSLPEYDAALLTSSKSLANYYEECISLYTSEIKPHENIFKERAKTVSNWIMVDLLRLLKTNGKEIEECPIRPHHIAGMLRLIDNGTISGKIAKMVFEEMYKTGRNADTIVTEKGLVQVTDEAEILRVIDEVLQENPNQVEEYRKGKDKLFGFFVGQIMKRSAGKANPAMVNELLRKRLEGK